MSVIPIRRASRVNSMPLGPARSGTDDPNLSQLEKSSNTVGDIYAKDKARIHIGANNSTYLQNPYDEPIKYFEAWLNHEDNIDLVFELAAVLGRDRGNKLNSIEHDNENGQDKTATLESLFSWMSLQTDQGTSSQAVFAKVQSDASTQRHFDLEALLKDWAPAGMSESDSLSLQKSAAKRMQLLLTSKTKEYEMEIRHDIFKWLVPSSMTDKMFEESLQARLQGTCDWVFQQSSFENWISTTNCDSNTPKVLWINGIAGSGKTVLCAKIVEYLKTNLKTPIGYFFLADSIGFTDPFMALRIWLFHMISEQDVFDIIRRTWRKQRDKIPTEGVIRDLFQKVVQHVPECTFILDGLDECGPSNDSSLNTKTSIVHEFLQSLWQAVNGTTTRILMTSRKDNDIQQNFDRQPDIAWFEHEISGQDVGGDINAYATSIVERLLAKKSQMLKDEVIQQMIERCDGQILWLKLLELALESGGKEPARIKAIILQTPSKLRDVYQRNWKAINCLEPYDSIRAINLLRWVAFAIRPLTVGEVIEALAIDDEDIQGFPLDFVPDTIDEDVVNGLVSICNGLIEIPPGGNDDQCQDWVLQLPHYSIKEYVLGQFNKSSSLQFFDKKAAVKTEEEQNMHLAIACLRYISFPSVWSEDDSETSSSEQGLGQMLREYASIYWHQHIKFNRRNDSDLPKIINEFFAVSNSTWNAWEKWFSSHEQLLMYNEKAESGSRIHYACHLGLLETVRYLLQRQPGTVNCKTRSGKTGLLIACERGHTDIADLLMSSEADIEASTIDGRTSLYFASLNNHISIVKSLILHGATSVLANERGHTPFYAACRRGHKDVVAFLLASNVDPTVPTKNGCTPLNAAAAEGHTDIVRLLLEKAVDIHAPDNDGRTPLYSASLKGSAEVVRILLELGAGHQMTDNDGWTPLMIASSAGHLTVTNLLLQYGADVSFCGRNRPQALYLASLKGYKEIAERLLEKGANVNTADWPPIHASSENGYREVTSLLLDRAADIELQSAMGWGPLHEAVVSGHVDVARLLIQRGADVNAVNVFGRVPIHAACELGHLDMVQLLAGYHAILDVRSEDGEVPIFFAVEQGHVDIARFLIGKGADLGTKTSKGLVLLHIAAENGHVELVKLLLDKGVNMHARDALSRTPFFIAVLRGHMEIARLLVDRGVKEELIQDMEHPPLIAASINGQAEMTRWLIELGVDTTVQTERGLTMLQFAAMYDNPESVRLLLDSGADIEAKGSGGTALLHAIHKDHLDVARVLLEHGADVSGGDEGMPMLCDVSSYGSIDMARLLIEHGADVSVRDCDGVTALDVALEAGRVDMVELLVSHGALDTFQHENNYTALYLATVFGRLECARLLLRLGDNISTASSDGTTPLHVAAAMGNLTMVRLFLQHIDDTTHQKELASASLKDKLGRTAFFYAAALGNLAVARLLLPYTEARDTKDFHGYTSLLMAVRYSHADVVEWLLGHEKVDIHQDVHLGHSLLWWSTQAGYAYTTELLLQHSGVQLRLSRPDSGVGLPRSIKGLCHVCLSKLQDDVVVYHCQGCSEGQFMLCKFCYESGIRCFNVSHELVEDYIYMSSIELEDWPAMES